MNWAEGFFAIGAWDRPADATVACGPSWKWYRHRRPCALLGRARAAGYREVAPRRGRRRRWRALRKIVPCWRFQAGALLYVAVEAAIVSDADTCSRATPATPHRSPAYSL